MSDASPEDEVAPALARTQRALLLRARLAACGPCVLGGAAAFQLALLAGGSPALLASALALGLLGAGLAWARVPPPELTWVGAYLDARLDTGAALASAAEVLERGSPFRELVLADAGARLRGAGPLAFPWRLTPSWTLALAVTALTPLALGTEPPPAPPQVASRSLLDPSLLAPSGGAAPSGPQGEAQAPDEEAGWGRVEPPPEGLPEPAAELPLDVVAAMERVLAKGADAGDAASGSGSASSKDEGADPDPAPDPILQQAQRDPRAALEALEALEAKAAQGDPAARARLDRLRADLARAAGAGGGAGGGTDSVRQPAGGGDPAQARGGSAPLPPDLEDALGRYFEEG